MVDVDSQHFRLTAQCGVLLLGASVLGLALFGNWMDALLMAAFLLVAGGLVYAPRRLPALFGMLLVLALLVNGAAWIWDLYDTIPGYDESAHFFTTFAVTLPLGFVTYRSVQVHFRDHRPLFFITIASFGISLGVVWEVLEFIFQKDLLNPVSDMIMDGLGAAAAGLAAAWLPGLAPPDHGPARPNRSRTEVWQ